MVGDTQVSQFARKTLWGVVISTNNSTAIDQRLLLGFMQSLRQRTRIAAVQIKKSWTGAAHRKSLDQHSRRTCQKWRRCLTKSQQPQAAASTIKVRKEMAPLKPRIRLWMKTTTIGDEGEMVPEPIAETLVGTMMERNTSLEEVMRKNKGEMKRAPLVATSNDR
mmetsp:Transcript_41566/g.89242  ORF Transcript_41566/g.89242 Transcript_41566/m.89242 type:complete len:164 (+) Transcript_41566:1360-1851(+)